MRVEAPAFAWLVEYTGVLVTRFQVGEDGKTAYDRIRGRKCRAPLAIFGERVLYKELRDGRAQRPKIESDWGHGIWLGLKGRTGEHMIGTEKRGHQSIHSKKETRRRKENFIRLESTSQRGKGETARQNRNRKSHWKSLCNCWMPGVLGFGLPQGR